MAYFSKEEVVKWYNQLPGVPLGAKIILSDPAGKVLIVKPTYRPGWQLVGGVVEKGESPLHAALRETTEETGLVLEQSRLTFKAVGYTSPQHGVPGVLCVVFAATLTAQEVAQVKLQPQEIKECTFVAPDALPQDKTNPSLAELLALQDADTPVGYVEDGQVKVKI